MEQVVPSVLQRLRASDIIRMAGLTTASLGQEYYRTGAVHSPCCRGAHITGVVEVPLVATFLSSRKDADGEIQAHVSTCCYAVEVELRSPASWLSACQCSPGSTSLCSHAAALLYHWLARSSAFAVAAPPYAQLPQEQEEIVPQKRASMSNSPNTSKPTRSFNAAKPVVAQRGPTPLGNVTDILTQIGLSELRSIAREYDLVTNGMNKQQLVEEIVAGMHQPEAVRRVAATLEKPQRQLLAALALAGGAMTDDEMRGLFERFALGLPGQLQGVLVALQSKGLLLRTSLNSSPQQRIGLSGALLDVGWYVPAEVRSALRISMPITPFDVQRRGEDDTTPVVMLAEPYRLLAELLLVARALDGYQLDSDEERGERLLRASTIAALSRPGGSPSSDGSTAVPPPADTPSEALLSSLLAVSERTPAFLRFAVSLLRLTDILHKDDGGTPFLRVLPNAAQVLLGHSHAEVLRELFELWLTQASYENLIDLQEDGLRLRCRTASLNSPILRPGELDAENSEARQSLVALLAQAPRNQWINFSAFARFIYRLNPLFLQKRQHFFSTPHWWLQQEEGRPLRPTQLNDWLHAEAHYLARLIRGPLYWWGACDFALSQDGRLLAFRLTSLADWLFDGLEAEDTRPMFAQALEIGNSEEVLVYCDVRAWPLIALMETFAETAGVRNAHLCYRLTPKAFGNALGRGVRPTELFTVLRAAYEEQPGNVLSQLLAQLERWAANYGRIRVYTGVTLLETADAMVMRELSATTSLDEQIVQSVHPTLHILKKFGSERLVENLKRHGQAPLVHDEEFLYGAE